MTSDTAICGFCGQTDHKVYFLTYDIFGNNYSICQCNVCEAYFLAPRPDEELLAKAYSNDYYGESNEKFEGLYEKAMDHFRKRRAKRFSKYLKSKASVLDIGCGNGRFLNNLLKFGDYKLYGIELEGNSAKRAALIAEIELKTGILEENDFEPDRIDAITMFQVFEHLTEPRMTLNIIKKILKKDGVLVMSFPNIDSLQARLFKGKWLHLDPPRHLFYFKPADLIRIMNKMGFVHIRTSHSSVEQNPFGMVQSVLNVFYKKRELLFEKLKGNKQYISDHSAFSMLMQKIFFFTSFPVFIINNYIIALFRKGATVEMVFRKND
jgi:SAM-dependent methyltransferase